jgi:restriction endonuclease S subunit
MLAEQQTEWIISNNLVNKGWRIDGCIHDGWLALENISAEIDKNYLYHLMVSDYCQSQFKNLAVGSTVKNLNTEIVSKIDIPLPPYLYPA